MKLFNFGKKKDTTIISYGKRIIDGELYDAEKMVLCPVIHIVCSNKIIKYNDKLLRIKETRDKNGIKIDIVEKIDYNRLYYILIEFNPKGIIDIINDDKDGKYTILDKDKLVSALINHNEFELVMKYFPCSDTTNRVKHRLESTNNIQMYEKLFGKLRRV